MPNPARGNVTVASSFRLNRVVVFDMSGHKMLDMEVNELATTFDVSNWQPSVYLVALHTPQGVTKKRLVVQ